MVVLQLEIGPIKEPPARAQSFKNRFLRCPAGCEMLDSPFATVAVEDLSFRKDAAQKLFTMPFNHACDPGALNDIGADSKNFHGAGRSAARMSAAGAMAFPEIINPAAGR
jgi:hypothetical protein